MVKLSTVLLYSYLNLESTKTNGEELIITKVLYSYLNLESTKTGSIEKWRVSCCTVT